MKKNRNSIVFIGLAICLITVGIIIILSDKKETNVEKEKQEEKQEILNENEKNGIYTNGKTTIKIAEVDNMVDAIFLYGDTTIKKRGNLIEEKMEVMDFSEEEKKMTITFGKNELEIDSVNSKISGKYKKEKNYSFENYFEEFYTKMKYENSEYNASFINEKLTLNMFQVDDEHVYIEVIGKVDGKIHFLDRVLKIESKGILKNVETDDQEPFTIEIKDDSLLLSGLVIEKEMNGEYKKEKNLSNREIVKKIYYNY